MLSPEKPLSLADLSSESTSFTYSSLAAVGISLSDMLFSDIIFLDVIPFLVIVKGKTAMGAVPSI